MTNTGNYIKERRIKLERTREEVAKLCNVSTDMIRYYETGRCLPQSKKLRQIIEGCSLPRSEFMHMYCTDLLTEHAEDNTLLQFLFLLAAYEGLSKEGLKKVIGEYVEPIRLKNTMPNIVRRRLYSLFNFGFDLQAKLFYGDETISVSELIALAAKSAKYYEQKVTNDYWAEL